MRTLHSTPGALLTGTLITLAGCPSADFTLVSGTDASAGEASMDANLSKADACVAFVVREPKKCRAFLSVSG